jgi:hypothetical protein
MTLERKRMLRKIEFTLTDDKIHPECHYEYHDVIIEDGQEIAKNIHREVIPSPDAILEISKKELHIQI